MDNSVLSKGISKAAIMQDRQLGPFSVSRLHFMYNIGLGLARTRLIFAVARRHGQNPEVDLYHLTPFQVGTVWQREHLGPVVSMDSLTLPVLCATGIVAVTVFLSHCCFQYILTSACALYLLCFPILLSSHQQGGEELVGGTCIHSTGALENDIPKPQKIQN